ncbi:MAG: DUF4249 family protein [Cyclobacteriaceae bacterium]
MKKIIHLILGLCLMACETTVSPDLNRPAAIIVIDAWLTHESGAQEVKLTRSQTYFDSSDPQMISGATVQVKDLTDGTTYQFLESETGYVWNGDTPFGEIGNQYQLAVEVEGERFEAVARLGRVPEVDFVVFRHNEKDYDILEDYFSVEFFASDLPGSGDTYWIRTWKNGWLLNKPSEINIAYDAGFSAGQQVDGVVFHKQIRRDYLNPMEERSDKDNYYHPPYEVDDSVYVEIHSIDPVAYDFLSAVRTQTDRPGGFSELFAVPLANVITNIHPTDPNSNTAVAGFFNMAAISSGSVRLTESMAGQLQN